MPTLLRDASPIPVSVFIITLNEETHLRRLLPQLQRFREVVIVDSGSTDQTARIAGQYSNVCFSAHPWNGFGEQKAHALSLCTSDWVLNLDADEELTEGFISELLECMHDGTHDAMECRRKLVRWGRMPRSFQRDDVLIRFFRKSRGRYTLAKVHERVVINGRVLVSPEYFLHHENLSFGERTRKSNQYSDLKARDKFASGARCGLLHVLFAFPLGFLICYLLKGCFMDGGDGFLTSMNHGYYTFMKYAKLWELHRLAQSEARASSTLAGEMAFKQR